MRFSRLVRPLIRRTGAYAARNELRTDGLPETSLALILEELTRRGVLFDPIMEVDGLECLPRPGEAEPCVILGPHMMLSPLITRALDDAGVEWAGIIWGSSLRLPGTRKQMRIMNSTSPMLFFNVRRCLRDRVAVLALVDRNLGEIDRRTAQVETKHGTMVISTALFRLAHRQNAHILLFGSRMRSDDTVVIRVRRANAPTPEGVAEEMATFVEQLLEIRVDEAERGYSPHVPSSTFFK